MGILLSQERRNTIYIAGPMSGYENYNFDNFNRIAKSLRLNGWEVKNPADHGVVDGADWKDYMCYDLTQLGVCGAIFMLNGWEVSEGAKIEHMLAEKLGMRIFYECK